MSYQEFLEEVIERVKGEFDSDKYCIRINQVIKNNGLKLDGIVILKEGSRITPNIYLNEYYNMFNEGMELDDIIRRIIRVYEGSQSSEIVSNFNLEYDFEKIKNNIVYKVVNYDKNVEMLKGMPHMKFLDLAIIFQCIVNADNEGVASIRITNEHCKVWKKSFKEILDVATYNTPRIFPGVLKTMQDVLRDLIMKREIDIIEDNVFPDCVFEESDVYLFKKDKLDEELIDEMLSKVSTESRCEMYVLSNKYGINGATSLIYNGLIEEFASRLDCDLYILPSSIHEVILIPKEEELSIENLKDMVCEINATQVPNEDILSDSVYIYSREQKGIIEC